MIQFLPRCCYCTGHAKFHDILSLIRWCWLPLCLRNETIHQLFNVRGGADKSLARPTSQCRRMESLVSERGVCLCAELQVFSCYRGWKEACQATRAISTTRRREMLSQKIHCTKVKVLQKYIIFKCIFKLRLGTFIRFCNKLHYERINFKLKSLHFWYRLFLRDMG